MSKPNQDIVKVIDLTQERFKAIAPKNVSYEAEKGFAMQILMNNGYLMKVAQENPPSLAQAITNVAAIGLSLNPAEKQAYLIPRNVKDGNQWISKVFLEPSYMGLCKLATDSGSIEWVQALCVFGNDTFTDNGPGERPTHTYNAFSKERGDFDGVYCVAKTSGGDFLTTLMPADEVNGIRDRSESYKAFVAKKAKSCVWVTDYYEQAKKTVVRRGFKMWPRSDLNRMAEAVHLSNENEGFEPIINNPVIRDYTAEQKGYYDQMIEKDDAMGMYIFLSTIEEGVRNNLYHSFEHGTKGKFQQVVDALYEKGRVQVSDYVMAFNSATDEMEAAQLVEELSKDEFSFIENELSTEAAALIREGQE